MKLASLYPNQEAALNSLRASGMTIVRSKVAPVVIAFKKTVRNGQEMIHGMGWRGNAVNRSWNYIFRSPQRFEEYAKEFIDSVSAVHQSKIKRNEEKAAARAVLKASDHWAVGDVIYNSWGYEQTNVDWYQVVKVNARSIVIREIGANSSDHGGPSGGKTAPRRNDFVGKEELKHCNARGGISTRFGCMTKWDGRAKYCSSYH